MTKDIQHNNDRRIIHGSGLITDHDVYLFKEGNHFKLYDKLGAHPAVLHGEPGVHFAVWAPNAESVAVIGDFNGWNRDTHKLGVRWDSSGIWEGFIPGLEKGALYKYFIVSRNNHFRVEKNDPFAIHMENPPKTASIVWDLDYSWRDEKWMQGRHENNALSSPMSIYEIHLGSWRRIVEQNNRYFSYRELAEHLVKYVREMGFTHVEFLARM